MSIGSVLVGIALGLVVAAYLARPFRAARAGADLDRTIEGWVAQVRAEGLEPEVSDGPGGPSTPSSRYEEDRVTYCTQCGRRAGPGDRFCAGCGTRLEPGSR